MGWRIPTKEELEANAREARRRTEEFCAQQKRIRGKVKKQTLSVDDAIKFIICYCEAEEQKQLTEWMH